MEKQLLSTYVIKIKDNQDNTQTLSRFNGHNDFFDTLVGFFEEIFRTMVRIETKDPDSPIHLTTEGRTIVDRANRRMYGFFSSGVSGQVYDILNVDTGELVTNVNRHHAAFKHLFFYIHVPLQTDRAALVLQRRVKFGLKLAFEITLSHYFRGLGYLQYRILVDGLIHGRVYREMMDHGRLKKVEFVRRRIPGTLEEYVNQPDMIRELPGQIKTTMWARKGLPDIYKRFLDAFFNRPDRERIEAIGFDDDLKEIEFELELHGKVKKFYIAHPSRTQPDVDVTRLLEIIDGRPTIESLVEQAQNLVEDIINFRV